MNATWIMTGATALLSAGLIAASAAGLAGKIETNTRLDNAIGIAMVVIGVPLGPWLYVNGEWNLIATVLAACAIAIAPWASSVPTYGMTAVIAATAIGIWWLGP